MFSRLAATAVVTIMSLAPCAPAQFPQPEPGPRSALRRLPAEAVAPRAAPDRAALLRSARVLYVDSHSAYLNSSLLEERLVERAEFSRMGLQITRNREEADLILEVERSIFTSKFTYSIVDPKSRLLLASGRAGSLFGTASGRIARRFLRQLAQART